VLPADVIDEAFAKLPRTLARKHRVDGAAAVRQNAERPLIGDLATQVAALNERCEKLAERLQSVESASIVE
jgi:hypothetical protein